MKFLMTFLVSLTLPAAAQDIFLRDNLSRANVGDYIVTSQNRTYTALIITSKFDQTVQIQEISVPEGRTPPDMTSWREWIQQGAPGNTGWLAYEVAPQNGQLLECFSFTKNAWCDIPSADSFLGILLNLRLTPLETKFRRRMGGGDNSRGYWQPKLFVNGQALAGAGFNAYQTRWPNDGSELGGKQIEMYLPAQQGNYPSYFPYWMQISGAVGKARMRIIDSGTGIQPPASAMPKRPLAFMNNGRFENGNLRLFLKTRPYYSEFHLVAIDAKNAGQQIPLGFSLKPTDQPDVMLVEVPQKELAAKLSAGGSYRFLMQPWRHPNAAAQTADPLRWEPQ